MKWTVWLTQTSDSDSDWGLRLILMGFSDPLLNLFQIKSVSARPWHTYPLHKFCLFLHNFQLQSKQAWAEKLFEKLKPQTYPDIWAGHQCTFSLFKSSITWLYIEKNLKKILVQFFFDSLGQFFLFSLFWAHLTHKWQKNKIMYLLRYLIATCFIGFLSSRRFIWYPSF